MNLNQVTLPVYDIDEANAFYLTLGFKQIVKTLHYSRFECANEATFSLVLTQNAFHNGATIYFECKDLDSRVAQLQARGIEFKSHIEDKRYLWREVQLCDPSGNNIKLYWAGKNRLTPPWRVDITQSK